MIELFRMIIRYLFSRANKKPIIYKEPDDFKKGEIYKMLVACRSYVKKPYYIIIKDVGKDYITTYIPGARSVKIQYPSGTWNYQIPRMVRMGNNLLATVLLYNQKLN